MVMKQSHSRRHGKRFGWRWSIRRHDTTRHAFRCCAIDLYKTQLISDCVCVCISFVIALHIRPTPCATRRVKRRKLIRQFALLLLFSFFFRRHCPCLWVSRHFERNQIFNKRCGILHLYCGKEKEGEGERGGSGMNFLPFFNVLLWSICAPFLFKSSTAGVGYLTEWCAFTKWMPRIERK